jgi:murein DD-endopeptidase MepM/ murein hydrolase activator NlpD
VVARRFDPPSSRYGPGHRGLDLVARPGAVVAAVDAGRVTHAGVIAGRGTLTVLHASGVRSTYEPVRATVRVGAAVARGQPIGTLEDVGARSHCAPGSCLHLGAIRGELYLDPLALLTGVRVRLLPLE